MKKSYLFILVLFSLLFAACSSQPAPNNVVTSWSEEDLNKFVNEMSQDVSGLANQSLSGLSILNAIPANSPIKDLGLLSTLSSLDNPKTLLKSFTQPSIIVQDASHYAALPRGKWQYNPKTGNWGSLGDSDDLVLVYPIQNPDFTTSMVQAIFDWNANAPSIKVMTPGGKVEVPTDMKVRVLLDGKELGALSLISKWYQGCGYKTLEPTQVKLKGDFSLDGTSLNFALNLNTQVHSASEETLKLDGFVKLAVGEDYGKFSIDTSLDANVNRNSDCFLEDIKLNQGRIAAELDTFIAGEHNSLGISFAFDNPQLSATGAYSVKVKNGKITANGATVVSFAGILDDANLNGVPGENLIITFDDGSSSTFEAILLSL
ncbi:MAG: hypothetical protein KC422_14745 [Trueperaceae bacterium]|nr:hypothetical protein [Trueperaceae bacterium]